MKLNIEQDWTPNALEMMQAQIAVLTDCPPINCDAIFIHWVPIQNNTLNKKHLHVICNAYKNKLTNTIILNPLTKAVCRSEQIYSTGVYETLQKGLISSGIRKTDIDTIPLAFNTAEESREFLKLAKSKGWKKLIISSQPHHQLRCFLQIIALMHEINFYPKVYNLTHYKIPQNIVFKRSVLKNKPFVEKFFEHVRTEYERIVRYANLSKDGKKFIRHANIPEMITYLSQRD